MSKRKIAEEEADQIERASENDEMWSQEPVEIESRPARTSVLSLRLPTAEFHALLRAARSVNETLSEYVRKAIVLRQRHEQTASTINVTYTVLDAESGNPKVEALAWRYVTAAPPEATTVQSVP